jgi:ferric-dicitrate binding protein FerR (iron transport regulator)
MTDTRGTPSGPTWNGAPEEDTVRALLEKAGPRAPLENSDVEAIAASAREQWRRRYGNATSPSRRGRWWMAVAAAAVLGVVGLILRPRAPSAPNPGTPVTTVALLTGTARLQPPGERSVDLAGASAVGRPILPGSRVETAPASRLALRTAGGASVRLDAATRVRLAQPELLELAEGAVYVDTGAVSGGGVSVRTPAGLFRPQGTQFEVRVEPGGSATRLRVRRGTVSLDGRGERAAAGEELIVEADGAVVRGSVAAQGEAWGWAMRAAPMLDIEGILLKDYLDWVAGEAGWRIEFADREAASRAETTVLHGSIDHLTPESSPGVVLSSCGMGHRVSDGALVIFLAGPGEE